MEPLKTKKGNIEFSLKIEKTFMSFCNTIIDV